MYNSMHPSDWYVNTDYFTVIIWLAWELVEGELHTMGNKVNITTELINSLRPIVCKCVYTAHNAIQKFQMEFLLHLVSY